MIMNGKVSGGHQYLNPLGQVNDGLMELIYLPGLHGFGPIKKLSDGAAAGGISAYDNSVKMVRAKKLRIENKKN